MKRLAFITLATSFTALAEDATLNLNPITIEAERLEYFGENDNTKVVASGNVEAIQAPQKILANFVEYDYNSDSITAKENVKVYEKTGYILDADEVVLKNKMRYGSISNFSVLMPDKSTLKATEAYKNDDLLTHIKGGSYTSCKICPGKAPIWDITTKSATLDEQENRMRYKNAVLHYYGKPVFYTPYFSHYTSKAKRKSGFLRPRYGGSSYLGKAVKLPYYINLAPHYDATLTPIFTSKKGQALEGEFRFLTPKGQINTKGSIASTKHYVPPIGQTSLDPDIRYNFQSKTNLALDSTNNLGWNINTTSDKSYRRDYNYGEEDFLTSRLYHNAEQNTGYYEIQSLSFQNLRPANAASNNYMNQNPLVLPLFESKHRLFQFANGSQWVFESNMLKIHRYYGTDSNRLSIKNKLEKSILTNNGHVFDFHTSIRNDVYYYKDASINGRNYNGTTSRAIPEAGAKWSLPLGRQLNRNSVTITPIVNAIATPNRNYNGNIYNEDSGNYNMINDTNLFSDSQFNGIDLVENTSRVSYGLKGNVYNQENINASGLFGQMYQQKPQTYFLDDGTSHFSDYVGRLKLDYQDTLIVAYQYTLDKSTFRNNTNELAAMYKYDKAYIMSDLLYYRNDKIVNNVKNRRELYLETGINDYNDFSFSVNARRSLTSKKDNPTLYTPPNGFISFGGKVKYTNECIEYSANASRDLTHNNERRQNTTFWFTVSLKGIS